MGAVGCWWLCCFPAVCYLGKLKALWCVVIACSAARSGPFQAAAAFSGQAQHSLQGDKSRSSHFSCSLPTCGREGGRGAPPVAAKPTKQAGTVNGKGWGNGGRPHMGAGGGLVLVGAAAFFCCAMRTTRQPGCPPAPEECVSCLDGGGSGVGSRTALRSKQRGSGLSVAQARWAGSGILRTTAPCAIFLLRAE